MCVKIYFILHTGADDSRMCLLNGTIVRDATNRGQTCGTLYR